MSGVPIKFKTGPRTYDPVELILGGQVVEARAAGRVGVAGAGSTKVLGVAVTDATSRDLVSTEPATVAGRPVLTAAILPVVVPVAFAGDVVEGVTYAAAAAFGDKLIAAANGQVTPAGATPDARTIVGICDAPNGVGAGARGPVRTV